jgi:hypothetical protein
MTIPNAHIEAWSPVGSLSVYFSSSFSDAMSAVMERCRKSHNGYCKLSVDVPSKPKTDGEKSQNNHAWGHATQIASGLNQGDDPRDVLYDACIATPGYPTRMSKTGRVHAQSWSLATTVQAAAVIETLHRLAAEFAIVLVEGKEET